MEELSRKHNSRNRTVSLDIPHRFPSPSSARPESPLRHRVLSSALPSREILAPKPQRHLLDNSASQLWLHTPPPPSPTSSRATSPVSASSPLHGHRFTTSFSALHHHHYEDSPSGAVPRLSNIRPRHLERRHGDVGLGRRWIHWMHNNGLKALVIPGAIMASILVKFCIGVGPYSGKGTPPSYGDYEAQRHWMELTIHLPVRQWYTYDPTYWGLDYPPLTAYVSWLCGIIGHWINPSWMSLDTSRGIETEGSKLFMRSTVIALDTLVYIPALILFIRTFHGTRSKRTQGVALLTLLFQPALLLIDNGHFQYNSVMLGFATLALDFFSMGQDVWGAISFVLSLCFKQMSLYYAPAIGSYLLAKCIYLGPNRGTALFIRLATATTLTFLLMFLPFLPPFAPLAAILDPIKRIFPFSRGIFEDKVATFWCASNVLFKWKQWASLNVLLKLSTASTALGFLPGVLNLIRAGYSFRGAYARRLEEPLPPTVHKSMAPPFLPLLPYTLLTSSMAFFLFSFHVHEKTILVPLLPLTLILSGAPANSSVFCLGVLVNNTAVFSMWPLLQRDGLSLQTVVMLVLWNRLIGYNPLRLPFKQAVFAMAIYTAFVIVHVAELLINPPASYPYLFSLLNVLIATPVFGLTWLWSIKSGIEVGWALTGLGVGPVKTERSRT